jgi:hypothetical protein
VEIRGPCIPRSMYLGTHASGKPSIRPPRKESWKTSSKNRAIISEMKRRDFGLALTAPVVARYPGPEGRSIGDARKWASRTSFVITLQARSVNEEVQYEA